MDVENAINQGLEVSGLQVPTTPPPDNPVDPVVQRPQRNVDVFNAPQYLPNKPPDQQDFYPQNGNNVATYNSSGGQYAVARGGQTPMGVLANRQAELNQQKAALNAQMAAFNPYGGLDKASYAHQPAFGKYSRGQVDSTFQQVADAIYGGDLAEARKQYVKGDPTVRGIVDKAVYALNDIAGDNQGQFKKNAEQLAKIHTGELQQPTPEVYQSMVNFDAAHDRAGNPIAGTNAQDYLNGMQGNELHTSRLQYLNDRVKPLAATALQTLTGSTGLRRDPKTGKLLLTEVEKKNYDGLVNQVAQEYVQRQYANTIEEAKAQLKDFFPDSEVVTVKSENPVPPASEGSGQSGSTYTATYEHAPVNAAPFAAGIGLDQVTLSDITGKKGVTPDARNFVIDNQGNTASVIPERVVRSGDKLYIVGKEANYKRVDPDAKPPFKTLTSTTYVKEGEERDGWRFTSPDGSDPLAESSWTQVQDKQGPKTVVIPYDLNENKLDGFFKGLTRDRILATMDEGHAKKAASMGRSAATSTQTSAPTSAEDFSKSWAAAKPGDVLVGPDGVSYKKK